MSATFYALLAAAIVSLVVYILSTWKYNYWKKKKVPHLKPVPLFGNYKDYILQKELQGRVAQKICQNFPNEPYIGTYFGTQPAILIQDPELIKLITTKDFPYFNGRDISEYTDKEPVIGRNLLFTFGDRWKVIRSNMTALFTASKIRGMFPLVRRCTRDLETMLERTIAASPGEPLDAQDIVSRYAIDSICSCGFGVETNTMVNLEDNNSFYKIGKLLNQCSAVRGFSLAARVIWPSIFYGLGLQVFPNVISDFFRSVLNGVFESRNHEPSKRNDFVDMVLNLKKSDFITSEAMMPKPGETNEVSIKIDNEFLVAQCIVFFGAGYETSSTISSFTLLELAKDHESQRRAAEEVDEYLRKHDGQLEYDMVNELPFLEACVDEAMRLYPALSVISREVMEDYTLPDGLLLEKGMRVHIPAFHLHRHPDYFPDPDQFRPERFLPENKVSVSPYVYMPFGVGQRICIGLRVGKMQTLAGLATILHKYKVELPKGAPTEVFFDPTAFVTNQKGGSKLIFTPRT